MIKIYTDGSCLNNPGNGGWAAIINHDGDVGTRAPPSGGAGYRAPSNPRGGPK